MESFTDRDRLAVTALRVLAIDQVEKAKSGHPGLPLGAAPMAYVLFSRFLRFDPADPSWANRDRFVLSAGHGSALLYALLHLFGFPLPLEELARFRQWRSRTPGHPEYGLTPGVECTTGPLGQGLAMAVGMALAERHLAARYNRDGLPVVDHRTFVLASDGDLMEGISHEAAALAGHLRLGKLVVLYDDNRITIEGPTSLAWSEDVAQRFAAYGWLTLAVDDGNDLEAIAHALEQAVAQEERPVLIRVRTHIGFGAPTKQDTAEVHGAPLGPEEHRATRTNLGWPHEELFSIPQSVRDHFASVTSDRQSFRHRWQELWEHYEKSFPELAAELARRLSGHLPEGWDQMRISFPAEKPLATREASGKVLNALASKIPELLGGSADLAPSNNTLLAGENDLAAATYGGRNLRFGVREHAMAGVANGMALHGGLRPYVATFLVFSDYLRPALRLAALQGLPVTYVFTHDSIGLGEDGPTHQPVEHLPALRVIPNLRVWRPADAHETTACWVEALRHHEGPSALVLTRQKVPILPPPPPGAVARGAYICREAADGTPRVVLWASGSEVHVALEVQALLQNHGVPTRVVSVPCLEVFASQEPEYRRAVHGPANALHVAVEAARGVSWQAFLGTQALIFSQESFGASAPGDQLFRHFGFTPETIAQKVLAILALEKPTPVLTSGELSFSRLVESFRQKLRDEAVPRLFARDNALWGEQHTKSVAQRLGWLDLPHRSQDERKTLETLVHRWALRGIDTLVLLGMGGSSLAPQVLREMGGKPSGRELQVLDTTDPVRVSQVLSAVDPQKTAVLAVSKSGTTVETASLLEIFWRHFQESGLPQPGLHFAALTEPHTPLAALALARGFAAVIPHPVDVGGRFSALAAVGLLPALWLGLAVDELLQQAASTLVADHSHPALELASTLAAACHHGWGRLLLWPDPSWRPFTLWLEQLIAESTGKEGRGVLPVAARSPQGLENLPAALHLGLGSVQPPYPGLSWSASPDRLGEAFALWELTTALVGFLLGVNPFDEPNVGEAKLRARAALSSGVPELQSTRDPGGVLAGFLEACSREDAVVLCAYLPETPEVERSCDALAEAWQRRLQTTVSWTFGPRYLHSTGQLHKGGPKKLFCVVLTAPNPCDLAIPGQAHTLGQLRLAQALGDVAALEASGQRVLHLHLAQGHPQALEALAPR